MAAVDTSGMNLDKVMRPSWQEPLGAASNFSTICFVGDDAIDNGFGAGVLIAASLGAAAFVGVAEVGAFDEDRGAVGET